MRAAVWRRLLGQSGTLEEGLNILDKETHSDEVILPEAPTDDEKYSYLRTHRTFIVGYGMFSCIPLSVGLWLFTLSSIEFIWFSIPATFISLYLLISYFGIAVWGKDFDLQAHERVVAKAEIEGLWPSVDVYLPCCGEDMQILQNTYEHVSKLLYDPRKIRVFVLDDSGKKTVEHMARAFGFEYICRPDRGVMAKAGNLRYAFSKTCGQLFLILDADFCPRPDFLIETVPYFEADPNIAILQTPQFFRWREDQTWVERAAGVTQEIFYRLVQTNRQAHDAAICVGTCGVYRRSALEPFGGTALISYSEDVRSGFMVTDAGWKVKYVPLNLSTGACPDNCKAFFGQQMRWCMGSTTLCTSSDFWGSNLTSMQKLCYSSGLGYYVATALSLFFAPMPSMLLILFRPQAVFWFNICFALPSMLMPFVALRIWSTQPYHLDCIRIKTVQYLAHLFAIVDMICNTQLPWVATGASAAKKKTRFPRAMKFLMNFSVCQLILIWAGVAWRAQEYDIRNFLPTLILETLNIWIQLSVFYE
jgi:cellulose synthase/poly-beta-1,6-N-acetylglucosamine synthase-like glycosyltransferase